MVRGGAVGLPAPPQAAKDRKAMTATARIVRYFLLIAFSLQFED
jgi:hypothetical protein